MPDPDPNADILTRRGAHEPAAVLRLHRRNWPGDQIVKVLSTRGTQLVDLLNKAMADERDALRCKVPVVYASLPHGFKYEEDGKH